MGDDVDMEEVNERCDQLRASIADTKSDYEKEKMQERLAKLSAGVAIIKVRQLPPAHPPARSLGTRMDGWVGC
jgi:hypothetical protein